MKDIINYINDHKNFIIITFIIGLIFSLFFNLISNFNNRISSSNAIYQSQESNYGVLDKSTILLRTNEKLRITSKEYDIKFYRSNTANDISNYFNGYVIIEKDGKGIAEITIDDSCYPFRKKKVEKIEKENYSIIIIDSNYSLLDSDDHNYSYYLTLNNSSAFHFDIDFKADSKDEILNILDNLDIKLLY